MLLTSFRQPPVGTLPVRTLPARTQKEAVLWIGRAQSGKDTHTKAWNENVGHPLFHCGDALDAHSKKERLESITHARNGGQLASTEIALRLAKLFTVKYLGDPVLHFNGIPRNLDQLRIMVPFLQRRGFVCKVIWFVTPEDVCMARPVRPGREAEDTPTTRAKRMKVYKDHTEPMRPVMHNDFGFRPESGNLLEIDNTYRSKDQTANIIIGFLGLNHAVGVRQLFPTAPASTVEPAISSPPSLAFAMA